jgi:hypothetical protein
MNDGPAWWPMNIAKNVAAHEAEPDLAKIDSERLKAHGWPAAAVQYFRQNEKKPADAEPPLSRA